MYAKITIKLPSKCTESCLQGVGPEVVNGSVEVTRLEGPNNATDCNLRRVVAVELCHHRPIWRPQHQSEAMLVRDINCGCGCVLVVAVAVAVTVVVVVVVAVAMTAAAATVVHLIFVAGV